MLRLQKIYIDIYLIIPTTKNTVCCRHFFTYRPLTFFLGGEFKKTAVFKNNTNTIFALQALYRFNGDNEIKERIFKMISKLYFSDYKESLTPSFGVLDLLCDIHMLFKRDQALSFANEIAS